MTLPSAGTRGEAPPWCLLVASGSRMSRPRRAGGPGTRTSGGLTSADPTPPYGAGTDVAGTPELGAPTSIFVVQNGGVTPLLAAPGTGAWLSTRSP